MLTIKHAKRFDVIWNAIPYCLSVRKSAHHLGCVGESISLCCKLMCVFCLFQVKIWFQNKRSKFKKIMKQGGGTIDANALANGRGLSTGSPVAPVWNSSATVKPSVGTPGPYIPSYTSWYPTSHQDSMQQPQLMWPWCGQPFFIVFLLDGSKGLGLVADALYAGQLQAKQLIASGAKPRKCRQKFSASTLGSTAHRTCRHERLAWEHHLRVKRARGLCRFAVDTPEIAVKVGHSSCCCFCDITIYVKLIQLKL